MEPRSTHRHHNSRRAMPIFDRADRLLGADDPVECLRPTQRHTEEEPQCARYLVDMRPRPAEPGQVKLIGANFLDPQSIRRTGEDTAELGYRVDVGQLGIGSLGTNWRMSGRPRQDKLPKRHRPLSVNY